jgi:hypothetical protein
MTQFDLYFAYGSNLDAAQMARRCPGSSLFVKGTLAGFRLTFHGGGSHWGAGGTATVVEAPGAQVPGVLFRVTGADVEALDGYEAFPKIYRHLAINVTGADGAVHAALTYQKIGSHPNPPPMKYFHQIWRAYRDYGLDEAALLAAVEDSLNHNSASGR